MVKDFWRWGTNLQVRHLSFLHWYMPFSERKVRDGVGSLRIVLSLLGAIRIFMFLALRYVILGTVLMDDFSMGSSSGMSQCFLKILSIFLYWESN